MLLAVTATRAGEARMKARPLKAIASKSAVASLASRMIHSARGACTSQTHAKIIRPDNKAARRAV